MRLALIALLAAATICAGDPDYPDFDGRAMLGINMAPPSSTTVAANGTDPSQGVEVQNVYPGTAAERMGIQPGDLITGFNGGGIGSMTDLRNEVALTGVGGKATVEVMRNGQKMVLGDALGEWPANIPYEPIDSAAERRFRDWQARRLDRTQQAVSNLRKQVEDLERTRNTPTPAGGATTPQQAMALPATQALAALPAFRLTLRATHDSPDRTVPGPARTVAWDARVLLGTAPTRIF